MDIEKRNIYFNKEGFILLNGDTFSILKKIGEKSIDLIFADPPYFLSSGGISCKNGKQVSVNKGEWDITKTIEDRIMYHRTWIELCRNVLTDNGTIWISASLHSAYAIGVALEMEGFSIINNIIWQKPNPTHNLACRCFTHSTETIIWASKQLSAKKKGKHYFDYLSMKEENGGKQMKDVWMFEEEPELWCIPHHLKEKKRRKSSYTKTRVFTRKNYCSIKYKRTISFRSIYGKRNNRNCM